LHFTHDATVSICLKSLVSTSHGREITAAESEHARTMSDIYYILRSNFNNYGVVTAEHKIENLMLFEKLRLERRLYFVFIFETNVVNNLKHDT